MVMLGTELKPIKKRVIEQLQSKHAFNNWTANLLEAIELHKTLEIYCPECKGLTGMSFTTHDDHWIADCNNCQYIFNNLDTELYTIVHYNHIKHMKESLRGID